MTSGEGPPPPDKEILNNDTELDDYIEQWKDDLKQKRSGEPTKGKRFQIG